MDVRFLKKESDMQAKDLERLAKESGQTQNGRCYCYQDNTHVVFVGDAFLAHRDEMRTWHLFTQSMAFVSFQEGYLMFFESEVPPEFEDLKQEALDALSLQAGKSQVQLRLEGAESFVRMAGLED